MTGARPEAVERLIEECRIALRERAVLSAVTEIVARAVADPGALIAALGEPASGGVQKLHVSDELTVLNVIWAPRMILRPHDHRMWAAIGVYAGREDNILWRRSDGPTTGRIEAAGAKSIGARETLPLGPDVIHSVANPTSACTAALHVYGGNFFTRERSEWDPLSLAEKPYDIVANMRLFEQANSELEARVRNTT